MHREPPHYLTQLTTTKTPKRLLWLDCAATTTHERGATVARYGVAALGTTHYTRRKQQRTDKLEVFDNPQALWTAADVFCVKGKRTVLFSYDLAQQIRTSQAMVWLPQLGWSLDNIVLERTAAWALYRDDTRSLMLCDLKSWCPVSLGTLAADVTYGKVTNVTATAGPDYQRNLCKTRALLVRDTVMQILEWIEGENLGPFRPTGSGQSYSAYRRRFMSHKLLVHDDSKRLDAERTAMWTGRCEAWQHGKLTAGPFVEYDMQAAYCTIARDCEVPVAAQSHVWKPTVARVRHVMRTHSVLAHVTVKTDVPVLPARMGGRTAWPVGEFSTWVWDPELALAFDYCADIVVHEAYKYVRAPALAQFGAWVLDGLGEQTQLYGLVPRRVLKHWSRCLVGRLGLRYRTWDKFAHTDDTDLRLVTYLDIDENVSSDMLIAGHDWLLLGDMSEALESLPQIPSWVMSECRRRLWTAMLSVGLHRVVYIDTDSIIIAPGWLGYPHVVQDVHPGVGWHTKGTYARMTINGPRNLTCESDRRVSGVPLTAKQVAPLEFTGQVMRSIKESMRAGELDCVASIPRHFTLNAPDTRREHLPNGKTAPFTVRPSTQEDAT